MLEALQEVVKLVWGFCLESVGLEIVDGDVFLGLGHAHVEEVVVILGCNNSWFLL